MNDISESEMKAMFERLKDWLNMECGEKVIDLVTDVFDGEFIQVKIPTCSRKFGEYCWWMTDKYGCFLFGYDYKTYYAKSIFEVVETHFKNVASYTKIIESVEPVFRKLVKLKGVGSLAELELCLAAMGEN